MKALALLALLLIAPLALAQPTRVDEIIKQHVEHGGGSPELAYAQLEAAKDRPGADAPIDLRSRYWFVLGTYAAAGKHTDKTMAAVAQLDAMAASGQCADCGTRSMLLKGTLAYRERKQLQAKAVLAELERGALPTDPALLLSFHLFRSEVKDSSGEFDEALASGIKASELAEKLNRPASQVRAMNRMVLINIGRQDLKRAEALSNEALALARRIGDVQQEVFVRGNQGLILSIQGDTKRQLVALQDVLKLTQAHPELLQSAMITQVNLSEYYLNQNQYQLAIKHAIEGEKRALALVETVGAAVAMSNRAGSLSKLGQPDEAIALMHKAIAMGEKADAKQYVMNMYRTLTQILDETGRTREALQTSYKVLALNTALIESQREEAVQELQEKYSTERKSREIERLSLDNARKQAEVNARAWQQRMWAAMAVMLLLAGILLVQWLRKVRLRNRSLEVDNAVLSEQSSQDPLTGAFNRRHCQRLMGQQEVTLHGRSRDRDYKVCVGLILLDVDFFKKVNDVYGHAAGDAVLVRVAERLQSLIREKDALVRWGGEEFVLILPGTPAEGLLVVAQRVLSAIGIEPIEAGGSLIPVTVSAGCIAWPAFAEQHWEDALHIADLALYLSKSRGRNRATCLTAVSPVADFDRVRSDLAMAESAGDVTLKTVLGPLVEIPAAANL